MRIAALDTPALHSASNAIDFAADLAIPATDGASTAALPADIHYDAAAAPTEAANASTATAIAANASTSAAASAAAAASAIQKEQATLWSSSQQVGIMLIGKMNKFVKIMVKGNEI
jgi:hypothetical protein